MMRENLPDVHDDQYRALALLIQHRELLQKLSELEREIESIRAPEAKGAPWRLRLNALLAPFTASLKEHFAIETQSTQAIFAECPDPERREALLELDRQHPELLRKFEQLLERVEDPNTQPSALLLELESAILAFRVHESREDEIFAGV